MSNDNKTILLEYRINEIRRFEILKTMYDNSKDKDNGMTFQEFALQEWDNVNLNFFNE